jgi:hypothetical protein
VFARLTAWWRGGVDILLLFMNRLYLTSDSDNLFNLRLDSVLFFCPEPRTMMILLCLALFSPVVLLQLAVISLVVFCHCCIFCNIC